MRALSQRELHRLTIWSSARYSKPQPPGYQPGALPLRQRSLELTSGLEPEPSRLRGERTATRALSASTLVLVRHAELATPRAPSDLVTQLPREVHLEAPNHLGLNFTLWPRAPVQLLALAVTELRLLHDDAMVASSVAEFELSRIWRSRRDSNPHVLGRQPSALPSGYATLLAMLVAGSGIEPP